MCKFSKCERDAVGVFLTDLYYEREIRKAFQYVCSVFSKAELERLVCKLVKNGTLSIEDKGMLLKKIERVAN